MAQVPGGVCVRYGRVVLGMHKGVAVPSPCSTGGSPLLLTKISMRPKGNVLGFGSPLGQLESLR